MVSMPSGTITYCVTERLARMPAFRTSTPIWRSCRMCFIMACRLRGRSVICCRYNWLDNTRTSIGSTSSSRMMCQLIGLVKILAYSRTSRVTLCRLSHSMTIVSELFFDNSRHFPCCNRENRVTELMYYLGLLPLNIIIELRALLMLIGQHVGGVTWPR